MWGGLGGRLTAAGMLPDPDPGVPSITAPPDPARIAAIPPAHPCLSSFLFHRRFPLRIPGAHFHQQQLLLQPQGAAGGAGGGSGRLDAPGLVAPIPTRRERLRGAGAARGRIPPAPNRLDGAQGGSVLPARIPPPPQDPAVARPSRRERCRAVPGDGWMDGSRLPSLPCSSGCPGGASLFTFLDQIQSPRPFGFFL